MSKLKRKVANSSDAAMLDPPTSKRQKTATGDGGHASESDSLSSLSEPPLPLYANSPLPPDAPLTDIEKKLEAGGHPTTAGKGSGARFHVESSAQFNIKQTAEEVVKDTERRCDVSQAKGSTRTAGKVVGGREFGVKREEVEPDVSQPATGTPADADDLGEPGPITMKPAIIEERANVIRFMVVTNDGTPDSMIVLTGLKNIFQRQLPKMPREYIARLVFSRDHYSVAIVKRGLQVVGGITYRPFEARGFAEIVFCAITGTEQVKGYGSHLMNHLKDHVKGTTECMHFLTYADNYAIGYFKKQGFSKDILLDRSVWAGYIKDYEGGTIMHCAMLPRVRYLEAAAMLARQKEIILSKIRLVSRSHIVHKGLQAFKDGAMSVDPADVPGLHESGWTPEMDELTRRPQRAPQHNIMQRLLTDMQNHPSAWPFARPINKEEVTDYYDVIKNPMDLETMEVKLDANQYSDLDHFLQDARQIFTNCRIYNNESSNYVKNANKLEKFLNVSPTK